MNDRKTSRPAFKYAIEVSNGDMELVFDGKRVPIEETEDGFIFPDSMLSGVHGSILDLYMHVAVELPTPVGDTPFRVRKSFLDLTSDQRDRFATALNHVYKAGLIKKLARGHHDHADHFHRCPQFLPWHRMMLWRLEQALQMFDKEVTMPYWDWTHPDAGDFETEMLGSYFGGRNGKGPFSDWKFKRGESRWTEGLPSDTPPSLANVSTALMMSNYESMRGQLEVTKLHIWAHYYVNGDMRMHWSPRDPLFYLHHCNIDRLWSIWQRHNLDVLDPSTQYSTDSTFVYGFGSDASNEGNFIGPNTPMNKVGGFQGSSTPQEMLDYRALGYAYPKDERLEQYMLDTHNKTIISGDIPEVAIWPRFWDFGDVDLYQVGVRTLTIINYSDNDAEITIAPPPIVPGPIDGFTWNSYKKTLVPGEKKNLYLSFAPRNPGLYTATLTAVVDQVGTGPASVHVNLQGCGTG